MRGKNRFCWASLPKRMITGPTILSPNGSSRGALLFENVLLHGIPPGSSELLRPVGCAPSLPMQDLLPANRVVARNFEAFQHLPARILGEVRLDEGAYLVAEGKLLPGEVQVHCEQASLPTAISLCETMFRAARTP